MPGSSEQGRKLRGMCISRSLPRWHGVARPRSARGGFPIRLAKTQHLDMHKQRDSEKKKNAIRKSSARNDQIRGLFGSPPQHPLWAALRRRRQKAEQADRGLPPTPSPPPSRGGGDLVLSLSSGLALLSLSLSLSARRPPNFSACGAAPTLGWPAAQKAESRASGSGTTPSFRGGKVI
jgi:hypothetical protein